MKLQVVLRRNLAINVELDIFPYALRVFPAETRLTVYRRRQVGKPFMGISLSLRLDNRLRAYMSCSTYWWELIGAEAKVGLIGREREEKLSEMCGFWTPAR